MAAADPADGNPGMSYRLFLVPGQQGRGGSGRAVTRPTAAALLGLADLAAGVIAMAWPGPTALVLVLIVGDARGASSRRASS